MMLPALGTVQSVLAVLLVIAPWLDLRMLRRLRQHSSTTTRLRVYHHAVSRTWLLTLSLFAVSGFAALWIVPPHPMEADWLGDPAWVRLVLIALLAAFMLLAFWPGLVALWSTERRRRIGRAVRTLRFLLPVTPRERRWWIALSLTAGVCEELSYRGYLLHYLHGSLAGGPSLSLTLAWLLSSLAFGLGHLYQGRVGVLRTTVAGLMFGLLALITGNLLLPIILHALVDLQVLVMYRPALDAPEDAALLTEGCTCP